MDERGEAGEGRGDRGQGVSAGRLTSCSRASEEPEAYCGGVMCVDVKLDQISGPFAGGMTRVRVVWVVWVGDRQVCQSGSWER